MQQQVVVLTKQQQLIQHRLGEPLADFLRRRYLAEGATLAQVGADMGVGPSAVSRWLVQFGIEARLPGPRAS